LRYFCSSGEGGFNNITMNFEAQFNMTENTIFLHNEEADIGGGKITISDIDKLKKHPEADSVKIMGLRQDTFEYFIQNYGRQLKKIYFFKNKFIEDLSLLGTLNDLEYVSFYHNQRVTQIWDMSGNDALKGLSISDFTRLHSIENIETAPNLEYFEIGNAIWSNMVIDSFQLLSDTGIRYLKFSGKKIEDEDLSFITKMKHLEQFDFAVNLFPTEKVAWIMANRPDIQGYSLCPMREFYYYNEQTEQCDKPGVFIVGKRKPTLTIGEDDKKIEKYKKDFKLLVNKYKGLSYEKAFPTLD
jgi:hypothetical protein